MRIVPNCYNKIGIHEKILQIRYSFLRETQKTLHPQENLCLQKNVHKTAVHLVRAITGICIVTKLEAKSKNKKNGGDFKIGK